MKYGLSAFCILLTCSIPSYAEPPSFNFIQWGYSDLQFDDVNVDMDGYELKANYELSDNVYLNYKKMSVDTTGIAFDARNIGLGVKSIVGAETVIFAQLDWANFDVDTRYNANNSDQDGHRATVGLRRNLTNKFEVKAAYEYLDVEDDTSDIFVLGAAYKISSHLSLYADYKRDSDYDQIGLGIRFDI
jgi:predicted porin